MSYKKLPDETRVWIYQANRKLNDKEVFSIKSSGDSFIESWTAHGTLLSAAFELFHNLFIVVFADENQANASGCSIDKSVHFIKELEQEFGLTLLDRKQVAYISDGSIQTCPQEEFVTKVQQGLLNEDTIVFNNLITTKKELESNWQLPVKHSWHSDLVK